MIKIENFRKNYGDIQAVRGMCFHVEKGELFGLIGPDGAGKTTLMRAICTLLVPDDGVIEVDGLNVREHVTEIRNLIGYMPQRFSLYQDLTVDENMQFFADIFEVPQDEREQRKKELYRFSHLEAFTKRKAGALSGGMKQKLALSCALIHTPKLLVLDEPTFGVDPVSRQEFWEILHEIQKGGTTILVSTAYMDEADQCDRIGLCFNGEIVGLDTPQKLKNDFKYMIYEIRNENLYRLRDFFARHPEIRTTQLFGDALHVSFLENPTESNWRQYEDEFGDTFTKRSQISPDIEDIFLDLMENHNG
ncbi:MAG: ABC transporter ATP-binding protein [Deferribacteres bacterium]|nr:ABC transporter ATP-binding protein [candidate division KSB1 bacterium]MCB9503549.1 ABC transporter ATP-binding protein [Deferribacteres bacterium]